MLHFWETFSDQYHYLIGVLCFLQPQADLIGLFQVLIIVFGEDPPVYSKVAAPPRPAYPPSTQDANLPYPASGEYSVQSYILLPMFIFQSLLLCVSCKLNVALSKMSLFSICIFCFYFK